MKVTKATKKAMAAMKAMKPKKKPAGTTKKRPATQSTTTQRQTKQGPRSTPGSSRLRVVELLNLYADEVTFNNRFNLDTPEFSEWLREM